MKILSFMVHCDSLIQESEMCTGLVHYTGITSCCCISCGRVRNGLYQHCTLVTQSLLSLWLQLFI